MKGSIGLVVAQFYGDFAGKMEKAACREAARRGLRIAKICRVPGTYDSPLAIKRLLSRKDVDGVALLGVVIKGDTAHDEIVAKNAAHFAVALSLEYGKPVTLGVIGHNATRKAARERVEEYAQRAVGALAELMQQIGFFEYD